jgi:hypothetical protein
VGLDVNLKISFSILDDAQLSCRAMTISVENLVVRTDKEREGIMVVVRNSNKESRNIF